MRKIVFRGFDRIGNKGWVYGDLVHNMKVTIDGLEPRTMVAGYEVYPESVGQFTGMEDCKFQKIFEGDILLDDEDYMLDNDGNQVYQHLPVVYDEKKVLFGLAWCNAVYGLYDCKEKHLHVIGNRFEHPELISEEYINKISNCP